MTVRPGIVLAAIFLCIYGALALSVDFPRAAFGFHSDEATYYMMGHSLVEDFDLAYRREDLIRVWREFPAGPSGVFLKKGRTLRGTPDPDQRRLFYGKSFIYPLAAAPFIFVFGTNGFLLLNALLLALVLLCAYLFLHARAAPWVSAVLAAAFVMASVVPVYAVWIMPEVFNFSLAFLAYFCWLYQEVAAPERSPRGTAWLFGTRGDLAAAALLGIATFSKPTNALLFVPIVAWQIWVNFRLKAEATRSRGAATGPRGEATAFRAEAAGSPAEATGPGAEGARSRAEATAFSAEPTGSQANKNLPVASAFRRKSPASPPVLATLVIFALVAGGLFAVNLLVTGEWNYQGGDRDTYSYEFPFQNEVPKRQIGVEKSREGVLSHIIFNPRTFTSNLLHNLEYFFVGRYAGLTGYFFPAVFAIAALLAAPKRRPAWQWLVLASGLLQGLIFIVATPYTWNGGGVGNRYFFAGYGVMLFALPPIQSLAAGFVPWIIGGLFVASMVLNPFVASFRPAENAKSGPLRVFPVELTLVNDLPVNNEPEKARIWFGDLGKGDPGFLVYFLDDNAYGREADKSFWVRGDARAEFIIKTDRPIRRATFTLTAGPLPLDSTLSIAGRKQTVHLEPGDSQDVNLAMPAGFPYEKEVHALAWLVSISSSSGFTPIFYDPEASDARYLGVRVRPMLEARPQ